MYPIIYRLSLAISALDRNLMKGSRFMKYLCGFSPNRNSIRFFKWNDVSTEMKVVNDSKLNMEWSTEKIWNSQKICSNTSIKEVLSEQKLENKNAIVGKLK
jgi:hypothetical protein